MHHHSIIRELLLLWPLALLVVLAAGCGGGGGDNSPSGPGGPVEPDSRLFGVWVPAIMQSSDAPPVENPMLGFRFSATHAEMAAVGRDGFVGRSHYTRDADGHLVINAVPAEAGGAKKHFVIEFFADDAARITIGSLQVFARKVDAKSVGHLPFSAAGGGEPQAANENNGGNNGNDEH